jgi:N-methylhydantoinase B
MEVWVRLKAIKQGETLHIDFTGTSPQIKGFKNSSVSNTRSAVYVAVTSFLDPTIPRNEGTYRSISLHAPLGSLLNPRPPAPMTMCTVLPTHEIMHAVWQALSQADPRRACAGWGKISHCNMAGRRPDGSTYVMYHWGALPGAGAVEGRDGFNQIGPLNSLGKLTVPNCETYEQLYPVRFLRHELRVDAAGAGEFRGGTGVDYAVKVEAPAEYAFRGEGARTPSGHGVAGGASGKAGPIEVNAAAGWSVPAKQFSVENLGPVEIRIASPSGGGWGDPRRRDPALVLRDVRDGILSAATAREQYGVTLAPDGRSVDSDATRRARTSIHRAEGEAE